MHQGMNITATRSELSRLLSSTGLHSVYQPIVDLRTTQAVAYEALLRGPAGTPLGNPAALFAAADVEGLTTELEWAGVKCAIDGALAAGMDESVSLFINVEGTSAGVERSPEQTSVLDNARGRLRIVFEVTERHLLAHPAGLLQDAERLRFGGRGMAIDDVGLDHPEGIAALSVVRPDVVKLDIGLIMGAATAAQAGVGLAVRAYVEEHGGSVIAEGIETTDQLDRALALGATLGQGFYFARPGPLPTPIPPAPYAIPIRASSPDLESKSAFDIASGRLDFKVAPKRVLVPVSASLEEQAESLGSSVFVFSSFQNQRHFSGRRSHYRELASHCALVAAYGCGLQKESDSSLRTVDIDPEDPLASDWMVVILSPHYAGALVSRDLGDTDRPDSDRRFMYAVTHNRQLVADLAASLMARIEDS